MSNRQNFQKDSLYDIQGLRVEVKNDDVNRALRKFKKMVQDSGILQDVKKKEYYEKPCDKRKREKSAARARHLKDLKKRQL